MTSGRKSRYFIDKKDSDIIEELLDAHAARPRTSRRRRPSLKEVVQYDCHRLGLPACAGRRPTARSCWSQDDKVTVGEAGDRRHRRSLQMAYGVDRARARRRDRRPLAEQGHQGEQLERRRPGDRRGRGRRSRRRRRAAISPPPISPKVIGGDTARAPARRRARASRSCRPGPTGGCCNDRLAKVRGPGALPGLRRRHCRRRRRDDRHRQALRGQACTSSGVRHTFAERQLGDRRAVRPQSRDCSPRPTPVARCPRRGLLPAVSGLQIGIVTALRERPRRRGPHQGAACRSSATARRASGRGSPRSTPARTAAPSSGPRSTTRWSSASSTTTRASRWCSGMCHSSAKPAPEPAKDDNHLKGYVSRDEDEARPSTTTRRSSSSKRPAATSSRCRRTRRASSLRGPERQQDHARRQRHHHREREGPDPQGGRRREARRARTSEFKCAERLQGRARAARSVRRADEDQRRRHDRDQGRDGADQLIRRETPCPAARVTDMIVSTATQGVPVPIIPPGAPTVLIGGHAGGARRRQLRRRRDHHGLGDGDDRRHAGRARRRPHGGRRRRACRRARRPS